MHKIKSENGMLNPMMLGNNPNGGASGASSPATESSPLAHSEHSNNKEYGGIGR